MKIIYKKKMKSSSLTLKKEKLLAQQPAEYQGDEKGRIFFFYGSWAPAARDGIWRMVVVRWGRGIRLLQAIPAATSMPAWVF